MSIAKKKKIKHLDFFLTEKIDLKMQIFATFVFFDKMVLSDQAETPQP